MMTVKRDAMNAVILLAFCGLAFYGSTLIPERSLGKTEGDFFPNIIIGILAVLSLLLLVKSVYAYVTSEKQQRAEPKTSLKERWAEGKKVWYTFALFGAYIFIMPLAGYFLSSVAFLFTLYLLLSSNRKRLWLVLIISIVVTYVLSFIFQKFLLVFLPSGVLF
ncbi:tripartite tricarboxylate transporter TctB family protein [Halobacillus kuroshimensis]|uniref:Tripartite tricarboxylate transporter TctB family protein n=1 Tax=Halobacillus kuroshimensis TaxID=302481 RepID=A0ABS3DV27_9BACI|nr:MULTISPECIES: tripartite tricarboxylate transporter TctB family protein [Halobacillus]MBN8235165.1 tripartite tricarboxylate transporter TctB family protein [Halobacillus kuroshimensis]